MSSSRGKEVAVRAARLWGLDRAELERFVERALDECGVGAVSVGVKLTTDRVIRELNRRYRGVARATDVLAFPGGSGRDGGGHLGDIAISMETAQRQANASGLSLRREVLELLLHGCLHLVGHDHETDDGGMARLEMDLRHRLLEQAQRTRLQAVE
jgi:probable rRNA maturation factor